MIHFQCIMLFIVRINRNEQNKKKHIDLFEKRASMKSWTYFYCVGHQIKLSYYNVKVVIQFRM